MWRKSDLLKSFFRQNRKLILLTFLTGLLAGLTTIAIPVAIGKYYDFLFGFHSIRARALNVFVGNLENMESFLVFFFLLVLLKTGFTFAEKYCTGVLGERFVYYIRGLLFQHQLHIPIRDYEDRGTGRYLLRFSGDLKSIQNFLTRGILRFGNDSLLLILASVVLFSLDFSLGLFLFAGLLFPLGLMVLLNRRLSKVTRIVRNRKSGLLSFTNSRLGAIHTIRFFNKEMPEQVKFDKRASRVMEAGIRYQQWVSLIQAMIPGLLYLVLAGLFTFIYYIRHPNGGVNEGTILIFVILLITILPILRRMLRVNVVWELGNISFEKLLNVWNRAEKEPQNKSNLIYKKGQIKIKELCFGFDSGAPLFKNLNLTVPGQGITLVKGKPGIGKSTLIKLLTGLYKPDSGKMLIDGQDIGKRDGKTLRKKIAVVSNELPLLGKTVFESISYSRKPEKRQAAEFLLEYLQNNNPSLPKFGLDDPIGDLGSRLSKGQIKLLSYARALLTGKPILLIDEPFDGLGPETIPFWVAVIDHLKREKTILLFTSKSLEDQLEAETVLNLDCGKTVFINASMKNLKPDGLFLKAKKQN